MDLTAGKFRLQKPPPYDILFGLAYGHKAFQQNIP